MWIIIIIYTLALALITLFSFGQLNLVFHYLKYRKKPHNDHISLDQTPLVTIQLPVYNEKYVVKRLLKAVVNLEYPICQMEIQVLDDSDDETVSIIEKEVKKYQKVGVDIQHIRRKDRVGYKAGALQYGMQLAKGEYIAIFDADFVPNPDFLKKTLPHFKDNIGMVQTRWDHLNKNYSLLTQMQAFGLDAHFTIEQAGRHEAGSFINFNGTAGVWKKECIQDAGGWQHDTLTEDLDLSYRAQLKGWKFSYLEEVASPAELPVVIPAIKSQQYRWNKGAAETARKNLKDVIKSRLSFKHKIRAVLHLLNSTVFVYLLIAAILSIPMLYLKSINPEVKLIFDLGSVFILGFVAIGIFYFYSSKSIVKEKPTRYFLSNFPLFLTFSMGMSLHNSIAILEGFAGRKTAFIRTPKFNILNKSDKWQNNIYLKKSINPLVILEGFLTIYFLFGLYLGIRVEDYGLMLFHAMLSIGFGFVFYQSLKHNA